MQKASAKKIKLAPKYLLLAAGFFMLAGVVGWLYVAENEQASTTSGADTTQKNEKLQTTCLYLAGDSRECAAELEIADNDQTRIKGLSGRQSLAENKGMLFVSDQTETQCFWMRGMLIPLDIIFVGEDKKVSKIEKNVAPETYPTQFCSVQPDKYVVELKSGSADRLGIKLGDSLQF